MSPRSFGPILTARVGKLNINAPSTAPRNGITPRKTPASAGSSNQIDSARTTTILTASTRASFLFLKFCSYFQYNAKWCLQRTRIRRQLDREQIAYQALDNAIWSCTNPKRLQCPVSPNSRCVFTKVVLSAANSFLRHICEPGTGTSFVHCKSNCPLRSSRLAEDLF